MTPPSASISISEAPNVSAALPSIPTVEPLSVNAPELISTAPLVVTSTSAAFPAILTPPAPSNVNAPAAVVTLDAVAPSIETPAAESIVIAPLASISNATASKSTLPEPS